MASSPLWVLTGPGSGISNLSFFLVLERGRGSRNMKRGAKKEEPAAMLYFGEMANVMQAARTGREPSQIRVDGCTL